jgi:hypothetical protein
MGKDISKTVLTNADDAEMYIINCGDEKSMTGGPICIYNGKVLPYSVGEAPNTSITIQMLANMLKLIDDNDIFHLTTGIKPFLLLNGHRIKMGITF